jgi:hypothetical protein
MKTFTKAHKLAAVLTATALTTKAGAAFATDFSTVSDNIVNSSRSLPNLVSTVAYVGGIGLGVAGVFKLKQHVDNPGQVMMKDGLVRLGAGGGLLALPFLTDAMTGTIGDPATAKGPDFNNLKFDEVGTD